VIATPSTSANASPAARTFAEKLDSTSKKINVQKTTIWEVLL